MPKKKGGKGGKKKRRGKGGYQPEKRTLEFKEDGQEYARVLKMLGDGRLEAKCSDGETRICHIRGKFRKRVWINAGDLVLVDIRSFEPSKADVVYKYFDEEDRTLGSYGELTHGTAKEEEDKNEQPDVDFGIHSSSEEKPLHSSSDSSEELGDVEDILDGL